MKNRKYLKGTILLGAESGDEVFKRRFTVVKRIDEGSSAVCYEAYHENSGKGILKEFYPLTAYAAERTASGQLIHPQEFGDAHDRFLKAEKEYVEPYEMLLAAKQNSEHQDLGTFIPTFEIYHGCDENGKMIGTTYIFTPKPKLETFDKICDEIHKHPNNDPEYKLFTVLSAIESLTKCIRALHCADIIHRDIKPSNFGFIKRGNETLTQALSLFDINTVCSVYGKIDDVVGTEGYLEPEAGYEVPNNKTDIYSIGATLFNAIIVTDEAKDGGYLYNSRYYDRLHEMVNGSELIRASEANSHPRLRNVLAGILENCLCERTYRYDNCEELIEDLETALYYVLPSKIARKNRSGEKWILADVEKSLDANKEKNSFLAIQYHLYEHPLYQCSPYNEEAINVLLAGFGNYGQKFLDACLQNGQIRAKKLRVTVVSDDPADKEIYLSERPQLANFFNIDGSLDETADSYGDIEFEITKLEREDQTENSKILQDIMIDHYDSGPLHYVFIALGEDSLNLSAVAACRSAAEAFEMNCVVSYVCENEHISDKKSPGFCPLYINRDIKKSPIYPELERMAFNTHLVWEKNLNIDLEKTKADFKKPYNHDSSISSVLALRSKLYSMGIDLETAGFNEAARQFAGIMADKSSRGLKNELIWIEHRRWVTEKLCQGWQGINDLEECAGGVTKDEKRKRHVCIVRSRPDQMLAVKYKINESYDKWDEATESELSQLDDLDRMSVELHRMFTKKSEEIKAKNPLSGNNIAAIKALIADSRKALVAFQEWFACLKDIMNKDIGKVRLYKGLKSAFLNAANDLPEERAIAVREQVKAFEAIFYPVLASMEYRDWKQDDVAFIDNIPFVLTYTESAYMVIPFAAGDNTAVFGNVAAPTVVNPSRIIYLYLIEEQQDIRNLTEATAYIVEYMRKKHFKASVDFVLICTKTLKPSEDENLKKKIVSLGNGRIKLVKLIKTNAAEASMGELKAYLKDRSSGKRFFALEKNRTNLSYLLQGAGIYNFFSCYQFDPTTMKFNTTIGCDMLRYIKKKPYITVTDMAAFRLSSSRSSGQPEFFDDYRELWDKYRQKSGIWKLLCDILGEYAEKNDVIATLKKKPAVKSPKSQTYSYIIPSVCGKSVNKIIRFLTEQEVLEEGSCIEGYTTDSCRVVIVDCYGYQSKYDRIFSNMSVLMEPDALSLYLNTKSHEIHVVFDGLVVNGVQISGNKAQELIALMDYFKEKRYVINLNVSPDGYMSFTYATRQIKGLLTTSGKMLEVYTYHKIKELGRFDDVVSSFEIDWEDTDVKSEFDCILTKGFRTLFVECKARSDIEQEFYFKLASLTRQFGINATAVLIADTQEKSFYDNAPVNAMQRKRGKMMDIVTIWKPDEINNIGHTLLKVINGKYVSEED